MISSYAVFKHLKVASDATTNSKITNLAFSLIFNQLGFFDEKTHENNQTRLVLIGQDIRENSDS